MVTIFHVLAFGFVNDILFDICHKKLEGECDGRDAQAVHQRQQPSSSE